MAVAATPASASSLVLRMDPPGTILVARPELISGRRLQPIRIAERSSAGRRYGNRALGGLCGRGATLSGSQARSCLLKAARVNPPEEGTHEHRSLFRPRQ